MHKNPLPGDAAIVMLTVLVYALLRIRRRRRVAGSVSPAPPMLERAVRLKAGCLERAAQGRPRRQQQLLELAEAYRSGRVDISDYNEKLDKLVNRWGVDI